MIRRWIYYSLAAFSIFMLAMLGSCQDESFVRNPSQQEVPEGYKLLTFSTDVPDMLEVGTRNIDSDGGGVQDLWLFCFTQDGYFLSTVKASITGGVNIIEGTFSAVVPEDAKIVHFIANYRMDTFDETAVLGKHETELIPSLVVSSGFMIYWRRMELPDTGLDGLTVTLIRNQARFQLADSAKEKIAAFAVYNTTAYGTVAPYNPSADASADKFAWDNSVEATGITLPAEKDYQVRLGSIEEPNSATSYVFETENTTTNPVSIVLRGTDGLYYRALVLDSEGNFLNIRRNCSYNLNLNGELSNGQNTLDEALNAPAVNNVWISIADNIRTISDGTFELSVENTVFVYETGAQTSASISYEYGRVNGTDAVTAPEIKWLENNEVGSNLQATFSQSNGKGSGKITFDLSTLTDKESVRSAVIQVKSGVLQRSIRIYLIKKFDFAPAWVSTQVDAQSAGEPVTLMFTVPEDFPEELLPFDVKIGADWLNVRESAGMVLSVITPLSHPDDFPAGDPWTFKFVYRVDQLGVQRVYFNTTLPPEKISGDYEKAKVTLEADHFETMEKEISFTETSNFISLSQLLAVNGSSLGGSMPQDDQVYYRLVPQKKNAEVFFEINTNSKNGTETVPVVVGTDDEFLIFTSNMTYYLDEELEAAGITKECNFLEEPVNSTLGSGYYQAFKPLESGKSKYKIFMKTTRPQSAEVVRIASPEKGMNSFFGQGEYAGQYFRSLSFELANYVPFSFNSSVTEGGKTDSYLQWTYEPDQPIDVQFDVTSFRGSDNRSADPFGTAFKVYIDAPMLQIDDSRRGNYTADRFYEESEGHFVLVLDADRENNRLGNDLVKVPDVQSSVSIPGYDPDPNADQTGEHHVLPFKKRGIVSDGQIVIRSEQDIVNFNTEIITVSDKPIEGTITYEGQPVPADGFVACALKKDGTRVGVMTIGADGKYTLQLRKVYNFSWITDRIVLSYRNESGEYAAEYINLKALFADTTVELTRK